MSELDQAVRAVVRDCLGVRQGEDVLVICNPVTQGLGERLRAEAQTAGAEGALGMMAERVSHAAEPPAPIAAAMVAAGVVMAPTVQSLSHTAARKAATEAGTRVATLPGVTEDMLARMMSADMEELRRKGRAIAELLTAGSEARITCSNGSDLRIGLEGRTGIPDAGELAHSGAFGNLPCERDSSRRWRESRRGAWWSMARSPRWGCGDEPVELMIEGGHLRSASGERGQRLMELLSAAGPDGTNVAELGIGTNEKAVLSGEVLEDEKLLGTAHVAFGASAAIGGTVQVPVHLDCVVLKPDLTVDGEPVVRDGALVV